MSKQGGNTDEKINKAIRDVLIQYKKGKNKYNIQEVKTDTTTTIYIIPVKLLGHNGDGLYFVHPSSEIYSKDPQKLHYSTAYVIPQDTKQSDDYTNINYIDVPEDYRGKRIASQLLHAVEQWCEGQDGFTLIRLENDTDINEKTGLPSTLYEKAGYHYLNKSIEFKFQDKIIMRSTGNEMEKLLNNGKHSEHCQFNSGTGVQQNTENEDEDEDEDEILVCKKSEMKKRDHWKHIEPKNMIGEIDKLVLRSGKTVHKAQFSRRVVNRSRSKVKPKRSRSKVKGKRIRSRSRSKVRVNTKNKSRRIKV
jgi:GNAT superfamily N-acetyltransferase